VGVTIAFSCAASAGMTTFELRDGERCTRSSKASLTELAIGVDPYAYGIAVNKPTAW
jgi:hypothetical protein